MRVPSLARSRVETPDAPTTQLAAPVARPVQTGELEQGIERATGLLTDSSLRLQEREMAVGRAQALNKFNQEAYDELNRISVEEDLAAPDTVKKYRGWLDERRNALLGEAATGHSEDSRLRLAERLEAVRGDVESKAIAQGWLAQRQSVARLIGDGMGKLSAEAGQTPEKLQELLLRGDQLVADMAPAMTPEEEHDRRRAVKGAIVISAAQALVRNSQLTMGRTAVAGVGRLGDDELTQRQIKIESGGKQEAVSPSGKHFGVMQVGEDAGKEAAAALGIPFDAQRLRTDREYNIQLGTTYRKLMEQRFGDQVKGLVAYNAGPENTKAYVRQAEARFGKDYTDIQFLQVVEDAQERAGTPKAYRTAAYVQGLLGPANAKSATMTLETLLRTPGLDTILTPDERRGLDTAAVRLDLEFSKAQRETEQKLQSFRTIMERDPTPQERLGIAGIPAGPKTFSQEIADIERVLGRPLKPEEIAKKAGVVPKEEGGVFGNSARGLALGHVNSLVDGYAAGALDPTQERLFESSLVELMRPENRFNTQTGQMEMVAGSVPVFAQEAVRRRGKDLNALGVRFGPGGEQPATQTAQTSQPGSPPALNPDQTIWKMASLISGPAPAIGRAVSQLPVIGEMEFARAPEMTHAKQFTQIIKNDLIRVLQNNPQYADRERQAIEKEIAIEPAIIDNPTAFRDRLVGIDDALEVRYRNALKTSQDPNVGREVRLHAFNVAGGILNFKESLGVPPKYSTIDDAVDKLPVGSVFRVLGPDGRTHVATVTERAKQKLIELKGGQGGGTAKE